VQLELFGESAPREAVRPRLVPNPDAYRLELLRRLNRYAAGRLRDLKLTDNRRTILSVRPASDRARLELRIHRSFLEAPEEVVRAVAEFVESKKGSERARQALVTIREHFSQHRGGAGARRRPVLRPEGTTLDLRQVVDDLNRRYFEGRLSVDVTWGRSSTVTSAGHRCRRGRSASLQLGSYSYEDRLIRIHRVLDDPGVPRLVVEAVVHHELLHADMPPEIHNGRRFFHTPEFRRRERLFRQLDRANAWIQEHLPELLRARKENSRRNRRS
jgi:predicted metal-dependent hydrolase